MTGFTPQKWEAMPWGRKGKKARRVWLTVKRVSGSAPTLIRYIPPQPSRQQRAIWVIEHESQTLTFSGTATEVVEEIEEVFA